MKKENKKENSQKMTIPHHVGVILDGNRRWAKEKGLPAIEGHKKGMESGKKIIQWCHNNGIKILTLFVFSTENWKRSKYEVDYLINLLKKYLEELNIKTLKEEGIQIRLIGTKNKLPIALSKMIENIENSTQKNTKMILNIAFSYGGRAEIVEAVKKIIKSNIEPDKINEDIIKKNLWTSDVDLIIRTGKEQRISNFLIWQAAYSEFYFSKKYLPDFTVKDLEKAILDFSNRQRRRGK